LFSVGDKWNQYIVGLLISTIGVLISLVWTLIQLRAINRVQMCEDAMKYIEKKLDLPIDVCTYSAPPLESIIPILLIRTKISVRDTMRYCCPIVMLVWIASLGFFLYKVIF
jgi:hypothetical protein